MGQYSPAFYRKLVLTTGTLLSVLAKLNAELAPVMQKIDSSDLSFARTELDIFKLGEKGGATREKPALFALQEGVISLHQLLSLLTASRLQDVSATEIVHKLLKSRSPRGDTLASVYTRMIPMGLLGPQILRGDLFNQPVKVSEDGRLLPTTEFRDFLLETKNMLAEKINLAPHNYRGTCKGCPMVCSSDSKQASGVDILAEIYLDIFKEIELLEP